MLHDLPFELLLPLGWMASAMEGFMAEMAFLMTLIIYETLKLIDIIYETLKLIPKILNQVLKGIHKIRIPFLQC